MRKLLISLLSEKRIAGGAAILAITSLASSVCGFLRDQAFSIMFPLKSDPIGVASVYIAAFRPSDLLFQVLVMSCLSVVVVPFLAGHLAHDRKHEMDKLMTSTMVVFGFAFGILALIMAIFFPWIAPHLVKFEGATLDLYIRFGRIALFTNFLFVFGNALGQYLVSVQRYWMYGLTPIIWALGTIAGTYLLTPIFGPLGPMLGTVIGTIVYVLLRGIDAYRAGFRARFDNGGILHDELKHMGLLLIPRMAALSALQLQLLLLDRLASGLGKEMVALNQFASNFESVIPGIVGIALAQSSFSLMSQSAARGDMTKLKGHIRHALWVNFGLAIPGAAVLALCASIAASLMHLEAFTTPIFIASLLIYALAVPFESTNHIMLRSFYSLKNTGWPALSSVMSCVVAVTTGTYFLDSLGVYALAVAYVTAQICQTIFLGSFLAIAIRRVPITRVS